jgi:hypothetical protein
VALDLRRTSSDNIYCTGMGPRVKASEIINTKFKAQKEVK